MVHILRPYFILHFLIVVIHGIGIAQSPTSDFSVAGTACLNETLNITNSSTESTSYFWDFCTGDFNEDPTITSIGQDDMSGATGYDLVRDGTNWYGYAVDKVNQEIYRFDYGSDPYSNPSIEKLTIPEGTFTHSAEAISMINFDDKWYGVISYSSSGGDLIRLDFGIDPTKNDPAVVNLGNFGISTVIRKTKLYEEDGDLLLLLSNHNTKEIWVINYEDSFDKIIDEENDIYKSPPASSMNNLNGIDIQIVNGEYIIHAIARNGTTNMVRYNYGNSLLNLPDIDGYYALASSGSQFNIELVQDGENYYGVVSRNNSSVLVYNFGDLTSITSPTPITYGITLSAMQGFKLIKDNSTYLLQGAHGANHIKTVFEFDCGSTSVFSNEEVPNVLYEFSGTFGIELIAYNDENASDRITKYVTVNPDIAPEISFTTFNECIGQENTLTPSDIGLVSYQWSFDGGVTSGFSSTADTTHTFSQIGDSLVFLTVNDGICSNFVKDTVSIYPTLSAPTFSTPGAPYCSGADLTFENLFDESNYSGATLTYDWDYNSEGNSNERDGTFAFDSEGTKTITLRASIPGCSALSAETNITVIAGPDVGFSFEDLCLGDQTQFNNSTTGTGITGQTWNFGDGSGTSSAFSPSYGYAAHGNYDVSLTVNNNQGCSNELTLPITIDDKPLASFNHGPACEGVDISFLDESSVDGLANITSYEWDFEGLGTSTNQNPNFTFDNQGSYDVELIVETSAGCRDTVTSTVNVLLAPAANFEVDLGCINTETIFLDKSEGDFSNPITQWIWTIDGSLASYSSSFGEVYNDAGDHTISLLVRSANSCQSVHNDNFTISELPVVDFTVEKACDNESTVFQDATNSSSAAIESYSWQFGNQGSSTSNPATYQFTSAGSYTVGLNIVDETGCEGSIQKTVTIHPSPTAIINASSDIGPAPLMIDFTDESQSTQSSFWLFGDEDESTSSENNPQFTYNDEGDYTAQLISTNDLGCSDTTSLAITVADPILDLELVQISTEESEEKTSVSLTVRNSGNVILHGFDIRIDLDNNSSIFESYSGTITRGESITYPLNFTFSSVGNNIGYTCITLLDRVEEFEDINIVNNESCIDFNQQLIIENSYPNPVRSTDAKIRLNMILPADGPVQIFLLDATGAVLYQDIYMEAKAGLNSFFLDIYSFEQGMYFIKTVYDQNKSTQRFVKM